MFVLKTNNVVVLNNCHCHTIIIIESRDQMQIAAMVVTEKARKGILSLHAIIYIIILR